MNEEKKVIKPDNNTIPLIPGLAADMIARAKQTMVEPKGVAVAQYDPSKLVKDRMTNQAKLVVQNYDRNSSGNDNVE